MPDKDIQAELVAVPGIGPWSAQMFMMQCIRRPDIFPAGNLGIRAALTTLDKLGARITPKAAEQRSQAWRPYRSYATSYLWGYIRAADHPERVRCRPRKVPGRWLSASWWCARPGPAKAGQGPLLGAGVLILPGTVHRACRPSGGVTVRPGTNDALHQRAHW
jgi:hypothetical protein